MLEIVASEDEARAYFAEGFTLRNLHVGRIAFAPYAQIAGEEDEAVDPIFEPRYPTGVGVYPPFVDVFVDGRAQPRLRGAGKRPAPRVAPQRKPRKGIGRFIPSLTKRQRPGIRIGDRSNPGRGPLVGKRTRTGKQTRATAKGVSEKTKKRSG